MKVKICGSKDVVSKFQDYEPMPNVQNKERSSGRCRKICTIICLLPIAIILFSIISFTCLVINAYLLTTEGYTRLKLDENPWYLGLSQNEKNEQAKRLLGGIKIDTMSVWGGAAKYRYLNGIKELHQYIEVVYPNIHQAEYIEKVVVNSYTLIYRVQGTSPSKQVYMLSSHLDTVNQKTYASRGWYYDPYLGPNYPYPTNDFDHLEHIPVNEQGNSYVDYIHGKGAIQAKNLVFGILEALENLIKKKARPSRTFYIVFGHRW